MIARKHPAQAEALPREGASALGNQLLGCLMHAFALIHSFVTSFELLFAVGEVFAV